MNGTWMIRGGRLVQPAPFCLVGIVNVTPDSFFDGGCHVAPDAAIAHGLRLLDEGAQLLDLGAESTRPGAASLGPTLAAASAAELERLAPALSGLRTARSDAVLCVDTCHAATARTALELGADVINDVSACMRDPHLLEVLAAEQPGYVLMHGGDRGGTPRVAGASPAIAANTGAGLATGLATGLGGRCGHGSDNGAATIVDRVLHFFTEQLERLERAGLGAEHVVLDPGIGFGKTVEENVALLSGIERLHVLGRPLYVGLSMKSLFGTLFGVPLAERGELTRIATALLATRGVRYHRVHEVAPAAVALSLARCFFGKD